MNLPSKEHMQEIVSHLKRADRILLLCHVSPDGDCIGSLLALGRALLKLGKDVSMASEDRVPANLEFLMEPGEILRTEEVSGSFETAVAIDSGDLGRLGDVGTRLFQQAEVKINIDHHNSNPHYGDLNLVEAGRAATGEIILELILHLGLEIDAALAEPLYAAILSDTGGFRFANTTKDTLSKAALLVERGARPNFVSRQIYENKPLGYFKMLALAFKRFTVVDQICYTWITYTEMAEFGLDFEVSEELSTFARMLENTKMSLVFKEKEEGLVKVSLRSQNGYDVSKLAERFGGGGHKQAAGCTINASLDEAISLVLAAAKEVGQQWTG
ncbi:MAG TPA: bifunctional oligoribonuclease/PAP phosphatase NrnA [Bacillota bacterium]|nr:bifunctional oligoribonuclease/PAP phosphatase NrnA [Bacillota bacterium]HPT62081.1 bifunctional oligoribonuclease/PAP phosphatase NrnA [Bacillota bacterium]